MGISESLSTGSYLLLSIFVLSLKIEKALPSVTISTGLFRLPDVLHAYSRCYIPKNDHSRK